MTKMDRPWITTWGWVLESMPELAPDDLVCFDSTPQSTTDPCLVADSMDLAENEDVPPEASERGWETSLMKEELQGVIRNLKAQEASPSTDLILRSIDHYVRNDAFLTLP